MKLALHDAANNCVRDGATAILTLRSGVVVKGDLQKPTGTDSVLLRTPDGWVTVLIEEIAAIEARR